MTYCVAIKLNEGLVMLSDSRTNAGIDNVSRFGKMFHWNVPGDRTMTMMTSGNLSITQGVINTLNRAIARAEDGEDVETILNCDTMYRAAEIVGSAMADLQKKYSEGRAQGDQLYSASVLFAGQRRGGDVRLYMVYSEGNFIEATADTPFLQIGEHKYGKPILDRVITPEVSLNDAIKVACLSMDSTLRSNLSVGPPLDLAIMRKDSYELALTRRIEVEDPDFAALSAQWSGALKQAFHDLPAIFSV